MRTRSSQRRLDGGKAVRSIVLSLLSVLALASCSVDQWRNVQRKDHEPCVKLGGMSFGKYCYLSDAGQDMPIPDAAMSGDGGSAHDAGTDATVYENCPKEGAEDDCYTGQDSATALQSPCHPGKRKCEGGHWSTCDGEHTPEIESCNGEDDDCDGKSDEGLSADPSSKGCMVDGVQGACQEGTNLCYAGMAKCAQVNFPQTDICDGIDNDCDGKTDEDTDVRCYLGDSGCAQAGNGDFICLGSCKSGALKCVDGLYDETNCQGQVTPEDEVCTPSGADMQDENCNGEVDEGCSCNPGTPCYTGSPASTQANTPCHAGTQACTDPTHGTCMNETVPEAETCANQGVDNDCDGQLDNIPLIGTSCTAQSTGVGACKTGAKWQCKNSDRVCVDAMPSTERCDGQLADEDCDGKSDEGIDLSTDEKNCGTCGTTCGAGLTCCSKACVNTKSSNSNCGACGKACTGLNGCGNGACALLGL